MPFTNQIYNNLKINRMNKIITSYFIDDNSTLHTFIGDLKHITFSNVDSIFEAELLIEEENSKTSDE